MQPGRSGGDNPYLSHMAVWLITNKSPYWQDHHGWFGHVRCWTHGQLFVLCYTVKVAHPFVTHSHIIWIYSIVQCFRTSFFEISLFNGDLCCNIQHFIAGMICNCWDRTFMSWLIPCKLLPVHYITFASWQVSTSSLHHSRFLASLYQFITP